MSSSGARGPALRRLGPRPGTGKTTLVERLVQIVPDLSCRARTRRAPPATGRSDGVDYNFITRERFEAMIAAGDFLEWADVFGNLYGTCAADTERELASGRDLVLVIDVQGARQVRGRGAETRRHLRAAAVVRGAGAAAARTQQRLATRRCGGAWRRRATEVAAFAEYDYVVVNDELDACVDRLRAIVLAERARLTAMQAVVSNIVSSFNGKETA